MVVCLSKGSQNYYIVLNILCPSSQPMARRQQKHVNPMPGIPKQYLKRRNSDGRQPICPGSTHRTPHGPCLLALASWHDFVAIKSHTCTINTGSSYVCPPTPASPESLPFLPRCPAPKRTLTGSQTPHISWRPSIRVSAHAIQPRLQLSIPLGAVSDRVRGRYARSVQANVMLTFLCCICRLPWI